MLSSDQVLLTVTIASVLLRHLLAYRDTYVLRFWKSTVLPIHTTSWEAHYKLPYYFLESYPWISSLDFILGFHPSFSRHGRIKASFILLIWLNENVPFLDQYVVINKLAISHPFPHREVSPFQFPCSSHFVPSLSAKFWDLMRIHWWLT